MNPFQTANGSLDEILFEKRNKSYGAYAIRQAYNGSVFKSLAITAAFFISLFFIFSLLVNTKTELPTDLGANTVPKIKITVFEAPKPKVKTPEAPKTASAAKKTVIQTLVSTIIKDSADKKLNTPINADLPTPGSGSVANTNSVAGDGSVTVNVPSTGTLSAGDNEGEIAPDVMPSFPGVRDFLARHLEYPGPALSRGISGKVAVNFIVDEQGNIIQAKVIHKLGYGCDEEALRVIKLMPKWKPGIKDGKPVKVSFNQVITFQYQ